MKISKRPHGNASYSEHVQFAARCEKRRAKKSVKIVNKLNIFHQKYT